MEFILSDILVGNIRLLSFKANPRDAMEQQSMGYHCVGPEAIPTGRSRNTETFGLWPRRPDIVIVEARIKDNVVLPPRLHAAVGNLLDCAVYLGDLLRGLHNPCKGVMDVQVILKMIPVALEMLNTAEYFDTRQYRNALCLHTLQRHIGPNIPLMTGVVICKVWVTIDPPNLACTGTRKACPAKEKHHLRKSHCSFELSFQAL